MKAKVIQRENWIDKLGPTRSREINPDFREFCFLIKCFIKSCSENDFSCVVLEDVLLSGKN